MSLRTQAQAVFNLLYGPEQLYAIRQKGTNRYLEDKSGRGDRATTAELMTLEQMRQKNRIPRLVSRPSYAVQIINQWKAGEQDQRASGPGSTSIDVTPIPARLNIDLEVVPVQLVFPK
jgi:hypothetical protein